MGQLVLLVVAAAWAAVLIPPLLRSRIENRPNSSVTDFRNQLSSLQRAVPTRSTGAMRGMARPLASSPLSRPAAAGRPSVRSAARSHSAGRGSVTPSSTPRSARVSTARVSSSRMHDASLRPRVHGTPVDARSRRQAAARELDARQVARRRRANVLFVLGLVAASSLFLAATTQAAGMLYVFALVFMALCGYVYLLGQARQREAVEPEPIVVAPLPREPAHARTSAVRPMPSRREQVAHRDRSYAV